jgi:tetratricopeptide (TPR) repeat protein
MRAFIYYSKRDWDNAIAGFSEAIRLFPEFPGGYEARATCYQEKGDYDHAFADLDKAMKLKSDDGSVYLSRSHAYANTGDYARALADANEALRISHSAEAYRKRGWVHWAKEDFTAAIADFNEAIRLDPDTDAYAYVGRTAYAGRVNERHADFCMKKDFAARLPLGEAHNLEMDVSRLQRSDPLDPNMAVHSPAVAMHASCWGNRSGDAGLRRRRPAGRGVAPDVA